MYYNISVEIEGIMIGNEVGEIIIKGFDGIVKTFIKIIPERK